jgi:hypothetical protein
MNERDFYEEAAFAVDTQTRFATMLDYYNSSYLPASVEDFRQPKKCLGAKVSAQNDLTDILVAIQGDLIEAAQPERTLPARGPLFPAEVIPARPAVYANEKLVFGSNAGKYEKRYLDLFEVSVTATDYVSYVPKNNQRLFSDVGDDVRMQLRKNQQNGLIFWIVEKDVNSQARSLVFSGYCY